MAALISLSWFVLQEGQSHSLSFILANSVAVLTALIGGGGLGSMIFEGLTNFNTTKILAGTLPIIGIALFLDFAFSVLERRLTPEYLKI